ncbi:copper resistance protein CopC [Actinomadura graeca]|uniref:Copper resistance protein CopC n=1 Tax=Actinomadura graeca TaxID=2750812 RepID=A0ABX8QX23_9ACTN|nr:copper resistance protein CopC [Actinomadura graeca]QXJ23263.1 copper resistance protein CopC [Actinomadura graeca]
MSRALARTAAAGAAVALVALGAAPASAHTTLKSADPASNSTVAPPSKIVLTYADPVMVPQVVLTDASGGRHEAGKAQAVDNTVTETVSGTLPNGVYTVGWRVVATDGHPVKGSFTFTVKGSTSPQAQTSAPAPGPSTAPAAAGEDSGGSSGWLWIGLGALVVALIGGGVAWSRRAGEG